MSKTVVSKIFLVVNLILLQFIAKGNSNESIVRAKVDTNQIRIGEQFNLELNATVNPNTEIIFPVLPDTFNHFEIVKRGKIDTIPNTKPLTLRQQFSVTVFDSGYFVLPPFPFLYRNLKNPVSDTITTEAILLGVRTVPVDTTKEIKDIKPVMEVPYPWREKLPYILGSILLLLVLIYLAYRYTNRKKIEIVVPKKPKIPAHIRAIENLKNIEAEKLWQSGFVKKYHIEVSDTIRAYIEERFDIPSMEQTSDETIKLFGKSLITEEQKTKLKYLLQLADMVKFAKVEPIAQENEQSIGYAYDFINSTIPTEKKADQKNEEVQS